MRRVAAASLLLFVACSSATTATPHTARGNRNVITFEEIQAEARPGATAWDLISSLRPLFLNSRGRVSLQNTAPAYAVVYMDGMRYGEIQALRSISVESIRSVEYLSSSDATTRYGTDHPAGAIVIVTR
ncbi:MAG TPA: hypothetical protein VF042_04520 [Gemmatimonadaceae bacterium]